MDQPAEWLDVETTLLLIVIEDVTDNHQIHLQTHVIVKDNPLQDVEEDQPAEWPNVETTLLLNVKRIATHHQEPFHL
jgi:hypothetical protein